MTRELDTEKRALDLEYVFKHFAPIEVQLLGPTSINGVFNDYTRLIEEYEQHYEDTHNAHRYHNESAYYPANQFIKWDNERNKAYNTNQDQVKSIRGLYIDVDWKDGTPEHGGTREAATDDENLWVVEDAKTVEAVLMSHGFPQPMVVNSGNGCCMHFLLEGLEPGDNWLIEGVLEKLAKWYGQRTRDKDGQRCYSEIDEGVFNLDRSCRLPGFRHLKSGRIAHIVSAPEQLEVTPREVLAGFVGKDLPAKPKQESTTKIPASRVSKSSFEGNLEYYTEFLKRNNVDFTIKHDTKKTVLQLAKCPIRGTTDNPNTGILIFRDGAVGGHCFEATCKRNGVNLKKICEAIDPTYSPPDTTWLAFDDPYRLSEVLMSTETAVITTENSTYAFDGVYQELSDKAIRSKAINMVEDELTREAGKTKGIRRRFQASLVNNTIDVLIGKTFRGELEDPCWISEPDPSYPLDDCFITEDSIINLDTGDSKPQTPDLFSRSYSPVSYRNGAKCTLWEEKLDEIFEGDKESIRLLQQWFGYCLTTDCQHERFLYLQGVPRAGKSLITDVLIALLGQHNHTVIQADNLDKNFAFQNCPGKRLITFPDIEKIKPQKRPLMVGLVKQVTGNDHVQIQIKYQPDFNGKIPAKVILTSNDELELPDDSGALQMRMLLLKFNRSFSETERDTTLKKQLTQESALEGILQWAISGWRDLQENGFVTPTKSEPAINDMARRNAPVRSFLDEMCEEGDFDVQCYNLHDTFKEWCGKYGIKPVSRIGFSQRLRSHLPKVEIVGRCERSVYAGLALIDP